MLDFTKELIDVNNLPVTYIEPRTFNGKLLNECRIYTEKSTKIFFIDNYGVLYSKDLQNSGTQEVFNKD